MTTVYSRQSVTWRYVCDGRVKHALLDPSDSTALCGVWLWVSIYWRGTGSQTEYETVDRLPECKRCRRRLESEARP